MKRFKAKEHLKHTGFLINVNVLNLWSRNGSQHVKEKKKEQSFSAFKAGHSVLHILPDLNLSEASEVHTE